MEDEPYSTRGSSTPPVLGIGVFLGQAGLQQALTSLKAFALATALGLLLGVFGVSHPVQELLLLSIAVAASSLAAIARVRLEVAGILLAGMGGLLIGIVSTPDPGSLRAMLVTVAGSYVGAIAALALRQRRRDVDTRTSEAALGTYRIASRLSLDRGNFLPDGRLKSS